MKHRINKFITAALIAAGTAVCGACSDFLEVEDESSVNDANFPSNLEHVDLLLNSAYAGGHGLGLYAHLWYPEIIYLLDKTHDVFGNYDDRSEFLVNSAGTSNTKLEKAYADIMCWIQYANSANDACEAYRPSAAETEIATLDYLQGQALFNRALAYWHAQIFFELESKPDGLGFPIIRKAPSDISEMEPQRAGVADTWQFVIETLEEASRLLNGHNSDKTRATYWGARGLLAKALMQARRPSEALPVLKDIIDNSGAILLPYEVYSASFYADEAHEFNAETLYEIDMSVNMKQNGPWGGFTSGSGMPMVMAPWLTALESATKFVDRRTGAWKGPEPGAGEMGTETNGGWGNNYLHDSSVRRFGWPLGYACRVRNEAYNASGAPTVDNFPWVLPADFKARSQAVRDNKECDPRLFIGCAQPWFDTMTDSRKRTTWYDVSSTEVGSIGWEKHLWFAPKKFTNPDGPESSLNFSSGSNYPIVRLADIYLLYAEAIAPTNAGEALKYVNRVHRRAYGADPYAESSPYDYRSLTDATCAAANFPDDILARDVIKYERWAELFAEGQWWFDVRRYEILPNESKVYADTRYGRNEYLGERGYAQPVPLTEIERYNGNLKQNYNY